MKREDLLAPAIYNIVDEIEQHAKGDKQALFIHRSNDELEKVTYKELIEKANKVAHVFSNSGLQKGDVMLVMLPRSLASYVTYIAALKVGLTIIPSSELLRAKDIDYRILHAKAKAVIAFEDYIDEFDEVAHLDGLQLFVIGQAHKPWVPLIEVSENEPHTFDNVKTFAEDVAFLAYTSGTTGNPKSAVHTHAWGYAHLRTTATSWLGVRDRDLVWATAAPGWQKWIWSPFLATLGSGATAFVYTGKFEAKTFLTLLEQHQINVLCCTPTEYRLMAKEESLGMYDLSSLHSTVSAGEPLNQQVIQVFKDTFGLQVRDGYGQTENTLLIGTLTGMEPRLGSMGKPTPGNYVEVIDEDGHVLPAGKIGDIAVHQSTPALFRGYLNDPERTAMQFRGDWYITGDRARKDADGYFWFEGRNDDIIISSGYTIGPFEVEDAMVKHPDVVECAVVASPDEIRGSVVKAFVVLRDPALKDSPTLVKKLQDHAKALTAPYKYPRKIEFVDELPKTVSGKIRRVELRQAEEIKVALQS